MDGIIFNYAALFIERKSPSLFHFIFARQKEVINFLLSTRAVQHTCDQTINSTCILRLLNSDSASSYITQVITYPTLECKSRMLAVDCSLNYQIQRLEI